MDLSVFGNVFNLDKYEEEGSRYTIYTKNDKHQLQVLQSKINRLLLNAKCNTPTEVHRQDTDTLSIQQLIAYQTAYKVVQLKKIQNGGSTLRSSNTHQNVRC